MGHYFLPIACAITAKDNTDEVSERCSLRLLKMELSKVGLYTSRGAILVRWATTSARVLFGKPEEHQRSGLRKLFQIDTRELEQIQTLPHVFKANQRTAVAAV